MKKLFSLNSFICIGFLFWIGLLLSNVFHVFSNDAIDDFTDVSSVALEFFIMLAACALYKKMADADRKIFLWLLFATVASFLGGFLCHIYYYETEKVGLLSFFIFYLFWIASLMVFLLRILISNILNIRSLFVILPIFIAFNLVVIALFFLSKSQYVSYLSTPLMSLDFSVFFELILFDLAVLCLICSEEVGMQFVLSGIPMILSAAFLFNYAYVEQSSGPVSEMISSYAAIIWFLGLILIFFGLLLIKKHKNYEIGHHFRKTNTIKSRLIFWTFWISIGSFLIFFVTAYFFNLISQVVLAGLPFFITSYSVVVITFSMIMGRRFEIPFKKLATNVEIFMLGKNKDKNKIEDKFSIAEFEFLQKFVLNMFQVNEEKDQAKKELGVIAAQVAHDIRSPTSAILMLAKERAELPEEQRVALRDAAHRIQDIANNLIEKTRLGRHKDQKDVTSFLISTALLSIISEKKLQYRHSEISITHNFSPDLTFAFVRGSLPEFKRVISNLLNNAFEAMSEKGEIIVKLSPESEFLKIEIIDAGRGMSTELVDKILQGKVVSSKSSGLGLGFSHARAFLDSFTGQLKISSVPEHGTSVGLLFPKQLPPTWLATKFEFYLDSIIVILDDDVSIHGAWDVIFSKTLEKYPSVEVMHFKHAEECISYIKQLAPEQLERLLLLTDYELLKENLNGVDVIGLAHLNRAVLVTSHYEDRALLKRAALLNTKILPKILASEVSLVLKEKLASNKNPTDLVVLEDNKEFSDVLKYLFEFRGKSVDIFNDSYDLLEKINEYDKLTIKICLDFHFGDLINGVELAKTLYSRGFKRLYLASGDKLIGDDIPAYVKVLSDKMELLDL